MPELLWRAYIDFKVGLGEAEKARTLYERFLERTLHVNILSVVAGVDRTFLICKYNLGT
jgi:hypothetical protein